MKPLNQWMRKMSPTRQKSVRHVWAAVWLGALPAMCLAQGDAPATQPTGSARFDRIAPSQEPGDRMRERVFRGDRPGPGMQRPGAGPDRPYLQDRMRGRLMGDEPGVFSESDWAEAQEFMKLHSPRRFEVYEMLPDDAPQKRSARRSMLMRHGHLKESQQTEPEAYKERVRRMELEDEVFGMASDLRKVDEIERVELRARLRTRIGEMVDLLIEERESRIARLQSMLSEERERLASFRDRREGLIDRKLEQEIDSPGGREFPNFSPRPRISEDPVIREP